MGELNGIGDCVLVLLGFGGWGEGCLGREFEMSREYLEGTNAA